MMKAKKEKRVKMERKDERERCENVWVAVNKGRRQGMFSEPYVPGV